MDEWIHGWTNRAPRARGMRPSGICNRNRLQPYDQMSRLPTESPELCPVDLCPERASDWASACVRIFVSPRYYPLWPSPSIPCFSYTVSPAPACCCEPDPACPFGVEWLLGLGPQGDPLHSTHGLDPRERHTADEMGAVGIRVATSDESMLHLLPDRPVRVSASGIASPGRLSVDRISGSSSHVTQLTHPLAMNRSCCAANVRHSMAVFAVDLCDACSVGMSPGPEA